MLGPQFAGIAASKVLGASGLLLDDFPNAAAAYSLRKLRSDYSGSAIRVRESGGDTESDIGFDGNDLDETALLNHCGANDGFVVTVYDQSGNARDATMATASVQPKIVSSGSLEVDANGNPKIVYVTGKILNAPSAEYHGAGLWSLFVAALAAGEDDHIVSNDNSSGTRIAQNLHTNGGIIESIVFNEVEDVFTEAGSSHGGTRHVFSVIRRTSDVEAYQDGVSDGATSTTGTPATGSEILSLGGYKTGGSLSLNGDIQEVIIWPSDQSSDRSDIETAINNHYSIF